MTARDRRAHQRTTRHHPAAGRDARRRTCPPAHARTDELAHAAERIGTALRIQPWDQAARHLQADIVVSALPPGAADPLAPQWPSARNTLFDVVYRPWPTRLAQAARCAGSTVIGGLPMLVHQAARQVELQTGRTPAPLAAMRKAAEGALGEVTPEV